MNIASLTITLSAAAALASIPYKAETVASVQGVGAHAHIVEKLIGGVSPINSPCKNKTAPESVATPSGPYNIFPAISGDTET